MVWKSVSYLFGALYALWSIGTLFTNNTKTTNCFVRKKRPNTPLVCRYLRMCVDQSGVVRRCLQTVRFIIFLFFSLARSKRPNTPHFVFKRSVRNFQVRVTDFL